MPRWATARPGRCRHRALAGAVDGVAASQAMHDDQWTDGHLVPLIALLRIRPIVVRAMRVIGGQRSHPAMPGWMRGQTSSAEDDEVGRDRDRVRQAVADG